MKRLIPWLALLLLSTFAVRASAELKAAPPQLSPAMQRVFDRADKNKNREIVGAEEIREMQLGLRAELADADRARLPGGDATYQQLVNLIVQGKPDTNSDGVISLAEFAEFTANLTHRRDALIATARNHVNQVQLDKLRQQQNQQAEAARLRQKVSQSQHAQALKDAAEKARLHQLAEKKRADDKKRLAQLEAQRKQETDARKQQEKAAAERRKNDDERRRKQEQDQKRQKDAKKKVDKKKKLRQ